MTNHNSQDHQDNRGRDRKHRPQPLIFSHRAEIARLYLQGKTQADIAARLGVTRDIVKHDLHTIREEWRAAALRDFGEKQAEELAKLDALEAEAWAAWEKSKRPIRRSRTTVSKGGGYQGASYTETVAGFEERVGDPRYLEIALDCVDRRIKLFGLDEPDKTLIMSLELVKVYSGEVDLDRI